MFSFSYVYFDFEFLHEFYINFFKFQQIEYDPRVLNFKQLLEVFWTSHDSRQVFGQGPDVGMQYRLVALILWKSFSPC